MKLLLVCLGLINLSSAFADAGARNIYCTQQEVVRGYILEATLSIKNKENILSNLSLGTGLLNEQGDGTATSMLYKDSKELKNDPSLKASSAQWKEALAYKVPVKNSENTYVLYVHGKEFKGTESFKIRFKKVEADKEKNIILSCSSI